MSAIYKEEEAATILLHLHGGGVIYVRATKEPLHSMKHRTLIQMKFIKSRSQEIITLCFLFDFFQHYGSFES